MDEKDSDKLMDLIREKRQKLQLDAMHDNHQDELLDQRLQHLRDLKQAKLEAENDAMRRVLAGFQSLPASTPAPVHENALEAQETMSAPKLSVVVGGFLDDYRKRNKPAMLKKHEPVLDMLLTVVGDKPVSQLRQADLNGFFDLLVKLPPRWKDACCQKGMSVRQLSEIEHEETIGPKTLKDTYIASIRSFLKAAKINWQDQGFPLGLTTDGIEYIGDAKRMKINSELSNKMN